MYGYYYSQSDSFPAYTKENREETVSFEVLFFLLIHQQLGKPALLKYT
jgi:hypothetical protein